MSETRKSKRRCCGFLLDLLLVVLLIVAGILCEFLVRPKSIGFFCNDETLKYPYKPSSVNGEMLFLIALALPLLLIICVELVRCLKTTRCFNKLQPSLKQRLLGCIRQIAIHYGFLVIGIFLTYDTAQIGKLTIGRLRPHFFAVCQPQLMNGKNCSDATLQGQYIEEYKCIATGFSAGYVRQIHYSFPSLHAAITFNAMLYLAFYLQKKFSWAGSRLARQMLQFCLLMLAWYTALTRIADRWHFWSDVLVGIIIGVVVAIGNVFLIARMFEVSTPKSQPRLLRQHEGQEQLEYKTDDCLEQEGNGTFSVQSHFRT